MERIRYRSTSMVDLQAELRERDLLADIDRRPGDPIRHQRRTVFRLRATWDRIRRRNLL